MPQIGEVSQSDGTLSAPVRRRSRHRLGSVANKYAIVGLWLVMAATFSVLLPGKFLGYGTAQAIFGSQQPLVFLGLAVVCTSVVGEFDISFAATMGFAATIVPVLVVMHQWSFPAAVAAALIAAIAVGVVNALLVVRVGVNSIVVTLGMSSLVTGLAYYLSDGTSVGGLDSSVSWIALNKLLGLPLITWYGIILVAIFAYVLAATPLGRHMLFVGSNPEVARLAGISVNRVRTGAYVVSSFLCGLAGVIIVAGLGGYDPTVSNTYLLPTFAAVFLGTAAVVPGRFNAWGMLIAVYFLLTGIVGLQLLGFSGWITDVFFGAALIVAVTVSHLVRRRARG